MNEKLEHSGTGEAISDSTPEIVKAEVSKQGGYLINHPDGTTETVASLREEREARRRWNEQNRGH